MQIGELARKAGVLTSRIRFYEARGLLPPAARDGNGYRAYGRRDLKIIGFILRAQSLGFSLREIGAFLALPREGQPAAQALVPILEAKLVEIDAVIAAARRRRAEIRDLLRELQAPGPS